METKYSVSEGKEKKGLLKQDGCSVSSDNRPGRNRRGSEDG